jgi:hypothetical protein
VIAEATKVCTTCGEEKPLSAFSRNRTYGDGRQASCKACSKIRAKADRQKNPANLLYLNTKYGAERRGLEFSLTKEWFVEKLDAGVCELTGLPFGPVAEHDPYAPSPDRIDNDIGYRDGNGRMILWWLNKAKGTMSEDQFQRCIADLVGAMRDRV